MSATRPAIEFSIGIMPSSAAPSCTAAKASSKVAQGSGVQVGIIVDAGDMRIGPRFALIGDRKRFVHACFPGASMTRARSRSSGASTPSGAVSTSAISTRMPASSARNCSSFSRRSSGEGGVGDKSPERLAAIGVETDVVQEPALAPRRARACEVERPQPGRIEFGRNRLDDVGIVFLLLARDRRRERRDVDGGIDRAARGTPARPKLRWSADRPEC